MLANKPYLNPKHFKSNVKLGLGEKLTDINQDWSRKCVLGHPWAWVITTSLSINLSSEKSNPKRHSIHPSSKNNHPKRGTHSSSTLIYQEKKKRLDVLTRVHILQMRRGCHYLYNDIK